MGFVQEENASCEEAFCKMQVQEPKGYIKLSKKRNVEVEGNEKYFPSSPCPLHRLSLFWGGRGGLILCLELTGAA